MHHLEAGEEQSAFHKCFLVSMEERAHLPSVWLKDNTVVWVWNCQTPPRNEWSSQEACMPMRRVFWPCWAPNFPAVSLTALDYSRSTGAASWKRRDWKRQASPFLANLEAFSCSRLPWHPLRQWMARPFRTPLQWLSATLPLEQHKAAQKCVYSESCSSGQGWGQSTLCCL